MKSYFIKLSSLSCIQILSALFLFSGCNTVNSVNDSRHIIHTGKGGTRVILNKTDIWTDGTPPTKYRVLAEINCSEKSKKMQRIDFLNDVSDTIAGFGACAGILQKEETGRDKITNTEYYENKDNQNIIFTKLILVEYLNLIN